VEAAHAVAYLDQLFMDMQVKPKGWDNCYKLMKKKIDDASRGK